MIKCKFEDGGNGDLRHVTMGAIIVNQEKTQILLGKRSLKLTNGGKYNLPGGFLGRDETTSTAILREVLEETGYKARIVALFRINDRPDRPQEDRQNVDFAYIVEVTEKVGGRDWESTEIKWHDLNNLPTTKEFAFDHRETIDLFLNYLKNPHPLPIIRT
jgi:ADP-ribose pyrophosphatase YjhB (NUDIX family)